MKEIAGMYWDQVSFNSSPKVTSMPFLFRSAYRELLDLAWQEDGLEAEPGKAHAYILSLCKFGDPAGSLIDGIEPEAWLEFLDSVFPVSKDGKRRNPKQERERRKMIEARARRSKTASNNARKRWYDQESNEDNCCDGNATASDSHATAEPTHANACYTNTNTNTNTNTEDKKTLVGSTSAPPKGGTPKSENRERVKSAFLGTRQEHYWQKHGRKVRQPNLDGPEVSRLIDKAIKRHDVETCVAAVRGIFRSPFHCGDNGDGTEYLSIHHALRINAKGDNVAKFAEIWERSTTPPAARAPSPEKVKRDAFRERVYERAVEQAGGSEKWRRMPTPQRNQLIDAAVAAIGKEP